jgi:hypothetical protein
MLYACIPQLCQSVRSFKSGLPAGENDIPGLTDEMKPRSRGPKRASRIRQLYNLSKNDDVRMAAKMHGITKEKDGKKYTSTVKIQRLITPATLQRKRRRSALKKAAFAKVCFTCRLHLVLGQCSSSV